MKADIVKTPCNHYYHETCINYWFTKKNTCPLCREKISGFSKTNMFDFSDNITDVDNILNIFSVTDRH